MPWRLVWVPGPRGPEAQKWPPDAPFNGKSGPTLKVHEMKPGDEALTLDVLARLYPISEGS